ncbi:MAG: hypothetical protein KAR42_02730 [candidate division Zixibacteria bacterium]|nr:hypothetical protein [candidate division Zixibacteria bacterium]
MRKVTVLLAIILLMAAACDKNDENTVNSIPKSHTTYPVFHLMIDNDYQTFSLDSVQLTVTPDIGWLSSVYSDDQGFIGTLASGTYITSIDTTIGTTDTTIDTTSVVYGFNPGQQYKFNFERSNTYSWIDSFYIGYSRTIDSTWQVKSADTAYVLKLADSSNPTINIPDSVGIVTGSFDTLIRIPDSTVQVERMFAIWFGIPVRVTDPNDTLILSPTSVSFDTVIWAYWGTVDSLYLPIDSSAWCDVKLDTIIDGTDTTINDFFVVETPIEVGGVLIGYLIDTVTMYINCDPTVGNTHRKIYNHWGWGDFDTTPLFTFPDTLKELTFTNSVVSIRNTVTDVSKTGTMYLIQNGDTTAVDSLVFDLTMPAVEVFPDYQIIIKD